MKEELKKMRDEVEMAKLLYDTKRLMMLRYPRFGSEIAAAKLSYNSHLKYHTAATDGKNIYFDPNYLSKLSENERLFLIAHELMHIKFEHPFRLKDKSGKMRNMKVWNKATDAIINANLARDGFTIPEGCVNRPEALKYTAEEFYEILLKEYEEKKKSKKDKKKDKKKGMKMDSPEMDKDSASGDEDDSGGGDSDEDEEEEEEEKSGGGSDEEEKDKSEEPDDGEGKGEGDEDEKDDEGEDGEGDGEGDEDEDDEELSDDHTLWEKAFEKREKGEEDEDEDEKGDASKKSKSEGEDEKTGDSSKSGTIDEREEFEENREERIARAKERLEKMKDDILSGKFQEKTDLGPVGESEEEFDWRSLLRREIDKSEDIWTQRRSIAENNFAYRLEENDVEDEAETEVMIDVSGSVNLSLVKAFLRMLKPILKSSKLRVGCFNERYWGMKDINGVNDIDHYDIPSEARGRSAWTEDWDLAVRSFTKKREINKIVFTDGYPCPGTFPKDDLKHENVIWLVYGNKDFKPCCGKVIQITERQLKEMSHCVVERESGRSR